MKKYILLSLVFFLGTTAVFASGVSSFVFLSSSQIISPGTLSKEIVIEARDETGTAISVPETFDLVFTSTSPTGQFLGSTGKPASKTMSRNTSKRTFYYKDSSVGNFTLTVTATGRESKKTFKVLQYIVVKNKDTEVIKQATITPSVSKSIPIQKEKEVSLVGTTTPLATTTIIFEAKKRESFIHTIYTFFKHIFFEE